MTEMNSSSSISGPIENNKNRSKNSTPLTPRSMIRLKPPVLREM